MVGMHAKIDQNCNQSVQGSALMMVLQDLLRISLHINMNTIIPPVLISLICRCKT